MMTHLDRLQALRRIMSEHQIAAYVIPSSDPHISEYLPDRYRGISWLSGFTGSAGTLVITDSFAGLWTDSRYFVQAISQLKGTGFELVRLKSQGVAEYANWLAETLPDGSVIAFDGQLISVSVAQSIIDAVKYRDIRLEGNVDLLDKLWNDRPSLPTAKARLLPLSISGKSTADKLADVRAVMERHGADRHLISTLDDIAWLFNIRGNDVNCNPVVLAFAFIGPTSAFLFIDLQKLSPEEKDELAQQGVQVSAYDTLPAALEGLHQEHTVLMDPKRTCYQLYHSFPEGVKLIVDINPTTLFKAIKNETEIVHSRQTMIHDGVALTRFFKWLEDSLAHEIITEISLADKLRSFRAEQPGFLGESFDTIAGYKAHGALPHYKATVDSNSTLQPDGLLLIDSGGQYESGTTDITRVVSLGNLTDAERTDYTLVLKAMIEGCSTIYPQGSRGYQIDAITRKPLWDHLKNYGHGTGHGVGFALNVHEGPQVFNAAPVDVLIQPGMITSIEPGLYFEGRYGIRIENLVLSIDHAVSESGTFLAFEALTLCYIDTSLIDKTLLSQSQIHWLNRYHQTVYEKLSPYLNEEEQTWLKNKTTAL
ncbi:Xaa-Pro aminopeptidase [bacterium A37T11]|nr:Xaa-Pro aminopeptidase [bacterium A37T11]